MTRREHNPARPLGEGGEAARLVVVVTDFIFGGPGRPACSAAVDDCAGEANTAGGREKERE